MYRGVWPALVLVLAGCTQADVSESASAEPSVSFAPAASPDESPSPEATPSTSESSEDTLGEGWTIPFRMTVPSEWEREATSTGSMFEIGAGIGRYVIFTQQGPPTVDEWVTLLTSTEQIDVTEPQPIALDGAEGFMLDATASASAAEGGPGICVDPAAERCWTLFEDPGGFWSIDEGRTNRLWIVDVDGETVLIVTDAPEAAFADWSTIVEEALATLEWAE
jgi:hypothetical protein